MQILHKYITFIIIFTFIIIKSSKCYLKIVVEVADGELEFSFTDMIIQPIILRRDNSCLSRV